MLSLRISALDLRISTLSCGVTFAILAVSACASAPNHPEPPRAEAAIIGSYEGHFVFGSERFRSALELRGAGPDRVAGAFRVSDPIEIEGVASGVVIDSLLRIKITWRSLDGCDGTIEGILSITDRGREIDGPVSVADCGEPVAGRMSFSRSNRNPE